MSNVKSKFKNLIHAPDWQHLIQKCAAKNCYLLLQNDDHFICGWGKKDMLLQHQGQFHEQEDNFLTVQNPVYC